MSEWQPIETATHYEDLLVWDGYYISLARCSEGDWCAVADGNGVGHLFLQPTHWMPLPEPPKSSANAGGTP